MESNVHSVISHARIMMDCQHIQRENMLWLMLAVFVRDISSLRQIFRTICKRNITPIVILVGNNLKQAQI
jgi:hypothetical protein